MIPLKRKIISEMTAKQLNLPVDLIDDIASYYFKYLQEDLSDLNHFNVNVPSLGTFSIKRNVLSKKLAKYENAIIRLENHIEEDKSLSMKRYASIVDMKRQVSKFKRLLELLDEEKERKNEKKREKINYKKDDKSN